jgi:preprotein translocase subunit YajC
MTAALVTAVGLVAATTKKSSSGSPILLIFLVIGAGFYFLIYRPQQRKAKAAREQTHSYEVGDEVLTAGGLVGYIIDIDGDRVTLETSVGASFVVLKQYILRTIEEPASTTDEEEDGYEDAEYEDDEQEDPDEESAHDADGADEEADADAESDADRHPSAGDGEPTDGKGGAPETTRSADGDDSGGPKRPPTA